MLFCVMIHAFFISNAFIQLSLSVGLLFHKLSLNVAYVLLNTYKHHHSATLFMFSIFIFMSRTRSIDVVSI